MKCKGAFPAVLTACILAGCRGVEDRERTPRQLKRSTVADGGTTDALQILQETGGVRVLPEQSVPASVSGIPAVVQMAGDREIRVFVAPKDGRNITRTVAGEVSIPEQQKRANLYPEPGGRYAYARFDTPVELPATVVVQAYSNDVADVTTIALTASERVDAPIDQSQAPELTTAALGMVIGEDVAVLGVQGKRLESAQLFARSGSREIALPLDYQTTDTLAILDTALESVIPPGTSDLVVRTTAGQDVLEEAIKK